MNEYKVDKCSEQNHKNSDDYNICMGYHQIDKRRKLFLKND